MDWLKRPAPNTPNAPAPPGAPRPSRIPPRRVWWIFLALLLGNWLVTKFLFPDAEAPVTVPYTVFKEQVAQGNVKAIYSQGVSIEGKFSNPVAWAPADAASAAAPPRPARRGC